MKLALGVALTALLLGAAVGAASTFALQDAASEGPAATIATATSTTTVPVTGTPGAPLPTSPATDTLYLVWTARGLAPGIADALASSGWTDRATTVRRDPVDLVSSTDSSGRPVDEPPAGFAISLDAIALDPASYIATVEPAAKTDLARLEDDEVVLGETSAALRGIGPGGSLTLAGRHTFRVVGVVDDRVIGGAEVAFTTGAGERMGVAADRYVLFVSDAERAVLEDAVRTVVPPDKAVRLRASGEVPYLRNGDAVLPQAQVKERFGEFAYRRVGGDAVELEPGWVEEHIVAEEVPLLGRVRCHRSIMEALRGALDEMERENLGHLVNPDGYLGCFVPRSTRYDDALSHHAWGVALDLNYPWNRTGQRSVQDERLIQIFEEWGFTWGGDWLVPDPAHVEFLRPPRRS
jgi:hypothetical protein